jgi:hypothetical protein
MTEKTIFIFYGYSGAEARCAPSFPDGVDPDRTPALAAETLHDTFRRLYPDTQVRLVQAWTKERLFSALFEAQPGSVQQVHVIAHGDATSIALAHGYDGGRRALERARRHNRAVRDDAARASAAMAEEDSLVAGHLTHVMTARELSLLQAQHAPGASWQLWGGNAGAELDRADLRLGQPELQVYYRRFQSMQQESLAREIAVRLHVSCTATRSPPGRLPMYGLTNDGRMVPVSKNARGRTDASRKPTWLWPEGSGWVTHTAGSGRVASAPVFLGAAVPTAEVVTDAPPAWVGDLYRESHALTTRPRRGRSR